MKHRDVVRLSSHRRNKLGGKTGTLHGGPESDLTLIDKRNVQEPFLVGGGTAGLEQGGEDGGLFGKRGELLDVKVVKHHVDAQDLLDRVQGLSRKTSNGFVFDDENGDGIASINLLGDLSLGEIVIEDAEIWVAAKELGDVEGGGGGGGEEKEESKG